VAEAVASGAQPRLGDQRSHPDGHGPVCVPSGTDVNDIPSRYGTAAAPLVRAARAPPAPSGRLHAGPSDRTTCRSADPELDYWWMDQVKRPLRANTKQEARAMTDLFVSGASHKMLYVWREYLLYLDCGSRGA
jgi:hypothetical protein